ncbi:protein FAR1-related sequence 8-like [Senna tora]|uniref:Protein FAR1-related sequence 8-like n=1 Tax=Senna tora TaxID=362788 RepID=A0A834TRI5_9FABA|nr:protein FAR1-related sequence 8-like [Senna tora]
MMTDGFTVCIYQNAEVCEESNGVAFLSNNFPIMTSLSRAIDFESLMQVVHQILRLQPYQQVSHLIYRMPYVSDGVRFFPCQLMDDGRVNQMFVCHTAFLPYLPMPVIEICAQITGVLEDSVGGDYIPEAPLQTVMSQEFLESQPAAGDDEYGGAITEVKRLLSIPPAAPNDDIGDEEYEDHLMGNDIEDGDYEEEDPNDYEREDPYQYEEVDMWHVGSSIGSEFCPTPHQSQINLSGLRGASYDGDITGISTWMEDEDVRSGLVFAEKDGVQDALKLFSLKHHVDYRVTRLAEKFIECKCVHHAKGCKWRVRASYMVDLQLWMISIYDRPHSCASTVIANDHPKLDSDMIVGVIVGLVTEMADIPISLVVETVKKAWGFTVSYKKAWRGKQKAIARVYGSWLASYNKLPGWMVAVQQAMPGTVVLFQTVDMPGDDSVVQFKRLFWAFKPCINAWWQLKPMLQVDGTFLYGKYKHSLLIAMGQDKNRNIVPVAFAPMEVETESAWSWFLWRLREHVAKDHEVCLISLRNWIACDSRQPRNWLAATVRAQCHEYTEAERGCQRRLYGIRLLNKDATDWIEKIPQQKWARAYDKVTALVLGTLYKVAEFFNNRRQQVQAQINAGHALCEELRDTIFTNHEIARICKVSLRNEDLGEFEVEEPYNQQERRPDRRCRVYLGQRLCDCGEFQQLHHPCIHVLAACADVTHEFGLYVDPVYKLETMLVAYSQLFHPVGGEEYWPHVSGRPVMPNPQALRPPGRPRSIRIRNEMDWK